MFLGKKKKSERINVGVANILGLFYAKCIFVPVLSSSLFCSSVFFSLSSLLNRTGTSGPCPQSFYFMVVLCCLSHFFSHVYILLCAANNNDKKLISNEM